MSLNISPPEQLLSQLIVGRIIASKAGTDNAKGVAACQTAIEWGQGLQQLASGDPTVALDTLTKQLQGQNLDPATLDALQRLLNFGTQQLAVTNAVAGFIPVLGATGKAILDNVAAGAIAAGNLDLAKYQAAQAAANTPKAAPTPPPA